MEQLTAHTAPAGRASAAPPPAAAAQPARSDEYIFQGSVYFFRNKKIFCRFQMTLRDAVDPQLLQQALDAVLARADYFRQKLIWEGDKAYLCPNDQPCLVYIGSRQRNIPEESNGYLFSVSCADATVYFDWYHFITDGYGAGQFMTQLLVDYCNLRYGTHFTPQPLVTSPMYSLEDMVRLLEANKIDNDLQQRVTQTCEGRLQRTIVRLEKDDIVREAARWGVKPFSLLLGLLCEVMLPYAASPDELSFSYPVDMRRAVGVPHALYNCVTSGRQATSLRPENGFGPFVAELDRRVRANLSEDHLRIQMAQQMGWVYRVFQMRAPLKIKKRVFQMGEYASGIPSDFWISYVGNPIHSREAQLSDYLTDYQIWVPPEGASVGIEEVSLNGKLILCLQDKTERSDLCDAIRRVMAAHRVEVLSATHLPDLPV